MPPSGLADTHRADCVSPTRWAINSPGTSHNLPPAAEATLRSSVIGGLSRVSQVHTLVSGSTQPRALLQTNADQSVLRWGAFKVVCSIHAIGKGDKWSVVVRSTRRRHPGDQCMQAGSAFTASCLEGCHSRRYRAELPLGWPFCLPLLYSAFPRIDPMPIWEQQQ